MSNFRWVQVVVRQTAHPGFHGVPCPFGIGFQIPEEEREAVQQSLLEYCELDTLAMVMIWEHWEWFRANEN